MRPTLFKLSFVCGIVLLLAGSSCKKKDKDEDQPKDDFDQKAMLSNVGTNIIVPAYQSLKGNASSLDSAVTAFNASPDNTNLLNLQTVFKNAYIAWQSASEFGFGSTEEQDLSVNVNTFPVDTAQINANITSGSYDLNTISNLDTKGFPGIDYLLFGIGVDNSAILLKYTTDSKAANRKIYLSALSSYIKTKVTTVLNEWTGGYLNTFSNTTGTDIGSSVGQMINQMDFDLEVLKNAKLGIPLGKQSMGTIYPTKTEAYYSGISAQLALVQLKAIQNIYLGKSAGGDGQGLDDYLIKINALSSTGGPLNDAIKNQFSLAISKLQAVPDPLSAQIISNPAAADAAYTEIQHLVVLLKTDMPSALGILITYVDNDGD